MIGLALALACASPEAIELPSGVASNLLMISADTLRRDHAGRYGGGDLTPWLDGFLAGGLALDDHRSCSNWTYPAALCVLGGQTGVELGWVPESSGFFEDHAATDALLPALLQRAGFESRLVTSNPYLGSSSKLGDLYGGVVEDREAPADRISSHGLEALAELAGADRWFLHAHYFDPHAGYAPPDDYLEALDDLAPVERDLSRAGNIDQLNDDWGALSADEQALTLSHLRARYAGEVRYLDDQLALLFEALESAGALDDTLVVFWSDHGEQLGEQGAFTHGQSLYRGEVDAIAGLSAPGLPPAAWSQPTTHADLLPTLLHLLGLAPSPDATGASVGEAPDGRARFAVKRSESGHQQSVVQGDLELIYRWDVGELRLYDRAADPEQREDLYRQGDPDAIRLWQLLAPRVDALERISGDAAIPPRL